MNTSRPNSYPRLSFLGRHQAATWVRHVWGMLNLRNPLDLSCLDVYGIEGVCITYCLYQLIAISRTGLSVPYLTIDNGADLFLELIQHSGTPLIGGLDCCFGGLVLVEGTWETTPSTFNPSNKTTKRGEAETTQRDAQPLERCQNVGRGTRLSRGGKPRWLEQLITPRRL